MHRKATANKKTTASKRAAAPAKKTTASKKAAAPAKKTTASKKAAAPAKKTTASKKAAAPAKKTTASKKAAAPAKKATASKKAAVSDAVPTAAGSSKIRGVVSPTTRAMFDLLCDGRWHSRADVLTAGADACRLEDTDKALVVGARARKNPNASREEKIQSGSLGVARNNLRTAARSRRVQLDEKGDRVRMASSVAREWRRSRSQEEADSSVSSTPTKPRQYFGEEKVFGGWREFEAWALSPLDTRDVAYVRPNLAFDPAPMLADYPDWRVSTAPDGLVAVSAPTGTPVKDLVTVWLADHDIHHEGVRDAKGVRRRDLSTLPPEFTDDLVRYYTSYAMRLIRERHYLAMQKLAGDHDDIEGEVYLWVVEAITDFNAEKGVPFGAWLTKSLANRVGDLSRAAAGRTAADAELMRARAVEKFEAEHGRPPTREELRQALGLTREEMHRKERDLAQLRGLRSAGTIEPQTPDQAELPIADLSADPEAEAMHLETRQQLSRALLAASGRWDPETGRPIRLRHLGFLITYLTHWGEWTKGDLVAISGRAARSVGDEVRAVQTELARELADLKDNRGERPMSTGDMALS